MKTYQRIIASILCIVMCLSFSTALAEESPWIPYGQEEEAVDISHLIDGYDKYQSVEITAPPIKTQEDYDAESQAILTATAPPLSAEMGVISPGNEIQDNKTGDGSLS